MLRAAGVTLGLPLLDSMVPAQTPLTRSAAAPKMRMGLMFIPHGAVMNNWTPEEVGTLTKMSRTLQPLEPFRDQVTVVSNLAHKMAAPAGPGDNGGDHTRSPAVFLNGVHPKRTDGADIRAGVTIDQMAAQKIGQQTPLPSLEMAIEDFSGLVGSCDVGFSCAYMNTISWISPKTPLPMETNPRVVFEHLFGEPGNSAERAARLARQKSILDSLQADLNDLRKTIGTRDRGVLSDYLDNVREIERRIQQTESRGFSADATPDAPIGTPDGFEEHVAIQFDLAAAAFQADITRVFTFMMSRELSQRTYPQIGVTEQHHSVSHHLNNAQKMAQMVKVNTYYATMYSKFLEKLKATKDGDGTLLDHSLMVYGAGMADSNGHVSDPLPMVLTGGLVGEGHRHVELAVRTPVGNLWRNVAQKFGVDIETFGDSNGIANVV